jgi:transposase
LGGAGGKHTGNQPARLAHLAPAYVKPFIKRQKNDAVDAAAICEAAQRPTMRFVPVKTEEQQANGIVFRARDLLVRQRTQCVNALRGLLMEYGYVFPKGITHVETLVALVEDLQSSLTDSVRVILKLLVDTFTALEAQITALDAEINQRSKSDPTARRLMTIPGVGPKGGRGRPKCKDLLHRAELPDNPGAGNHDEQTIAGTNNM